VRRAGGAYHPWSPARLRARRGLATGAHVRHRWACTVTRRQLRLLGASYDSNTTFHLAEYRAPGQTPRREGAPILEGGQRVWKTYHDIALDADIFPEIGADFEASGAVTLGQVGSAQARLFSSRAAVDFAQAWLTARRS
jgi:aminoglycoside N3'-acetyltransferase